MALKIRDLKIRIPLALAPMVGLSHSALRSLIVELGGAGLFFTEMLSAKRLPSENEKFSPFLIRDACEHPLFYQIYISQEQELDLVTDKLVMLGAQGIDINLGCPAPQLRKIGAGQELFNNISSTISIIKRLRSETELPMSVKIRLGDREDSSKLLDTCLLFQDIGIDLINIHARLNNEKFCRRPRWDAIGKITSKISIPVFANGGIYTVGDAKQCLEQSGAAGLMIGRGAAHRPWLFREIAKDLYGIEQNSERLDGKDVYSRFIYLLESRFSPERRLGRLKQFSHYFASNYSFGHLFASKIQNSATMDQAVENANQFFKTCCNHSKGGYVL